MDKSIPAIYNGIQIVMDEIGAIGKTKRNQQQGFNFRGIDDVLNVLHPLLAKAHIFIVPEVEDVTREERTTKTGTMLIYTIAKINYYFCSTEDGSKVATTVYGEAMDTGDKGLNKAMSIAMKYACFQIFCIPTVEMVDPDAETHDVAPRQKPAYPKAFLDACKVRIGTAEHGTTLGKLYKDQRAVFDSLLKTGTEEERNACRIIIKYMEEHKDE